MSSPLELMVASFDGENEAADVLKKLKTLDRKQVIHLVNAAVLAKNAQGKFRLFETEDINPAQGAVFGAITGGLLGLLGGPAGVVVGAAAGAAVGGVTAGQVDMGFENDTLAAFESSLVDDSSALIALVEHRWADQLEQALQTFSDDLFRHALNEETSKTIWERLNPTAGGPVAKGE